MSAVLLEAENLASSNGVAQGCSLSALFSSFYEGFIEGGRKANIGIQLSSGKKVGGLLFADDVVGVCNLAESLQSLLETVLGYCSKRRLRTTRRAVMVFSKAAASVEWKCGEHRLYT